MRKNEFNMQLPSCVILFSVRFNLVLCTLFFLWTKQILHLNNLITTFWCSALDMLHCCSFITIWKDFKSRDKLYYYTKNKYCKLLVDFFVLFCYCWLHIWDIFHYTFGNLVEYSRKEHINIFLKCHCLSI